MVSSERKKIAVGCQGGGMHAAFEVGVLTEILKDCEKKKFELVGLSGTSAGALCALMVWYGLVPKNGRPGSESAAIDKLNDFWDHFVAKAGAETVLNSTDIRRTQGRGDGDTGAWNKCADLRPQSSRRVLQADRPFAAAPWRTQAIF